MEYLVWGGAGLTVLGLCGLVACIVLAMRARAAGLEEAALRAQLQKVVDLNLAALAICGLGRRAVSLGRSLS